MLAVTISALAFTPGLTPQQGPAGAVSRRAFFTNAAGFAAAATFAAPAFADGANNPGNAFKARSIYGSRIFKLKGASTAAVLEEKNAFTLFVSGTYRTIDKKDTKVALTKIQKDLLAAAEKGDSAKTQALLGDFIKVGGITKDYTEVPGANYNPTQRRNAGAPGTFEIEDQMGPAKYALYKPLSGTEKIVGK